MKESAMKLQSWLESHGFTVVSVEGKVWTIEDDQAITKLLVKRYQDGRTATYEIIEVKHK